MPNNDKIIAYFQDNDPDLIPYVKKIRAVMPDLTDVFDIEEMANFMMLTPDKFKDMSIPEVYHMMHYDDDLYFEALAAQSENLEGVIKIDGEKTEKAIRKAMKKKPDILDVLNGEDHRFHGVELNPVKMSRILSLNTTGRELCTASSQLHLVSSAVPSDDEPNVMLLIDASGTSLFLMQKRQLSMLETLMNLSDDFGIAKTDRGFRLSFGIREVWKIFED